MEPEDGPDVTKEYLKANSQQALKAVAEERLAEDEAMDEPAEDGLKYPELAFPYAALEPGSKLKAFVDKACEGGLDPGLVCPAIMVIASAIPRRDKHCGVRCNLYGTLLALVGAGKDAAMDRAIDAMGLRDKEGVLWSSHSPAGERALAQHIGDKPATKNDPRQPGRGGSAC